MAKPDGKLSVSSFKHFKKINIFLYKINWLGGRRASQAAGDGSRARREEKQAVATGQKCEDRSRGEQSVEEICR